MRATNYANFCICIRLHSFFAIFFQKKINILTEETNVNECNEKTTSWTTRKIKERQFRMRNESFYLFFKKIFFFSHFLAFLAFQRDKRDVVVVVVVTFVPQLFMWGCGWSFHCSRSKRLQRVVHRTPATVVVVVVTLQRVVHRTPTTTTTKTSICVLSKSTWRLYKRMYLLVSSQHLHITKLR